MARLVAGILALNLIVAVLVTLTLLDSRRQHEKLALATVQNLSRLIEQDLSSAFHKIDLALLSVSDELSRLGHTGHMDADSLNAFIARQAMRLPEISHLRATNERGDLLYGTGLSPDVHVNVANREFFPRLRDDPRAGLIVSKPVVSYTSGKWQLVVTRRMNHPDGSFAGIVPALIELDKISEKFSSLDIGRNGIINLFDADLAMVSRYPSLGRDKTPIGKKIVSPQFLEALGRAPGAGTFYATSPLDRLERVFSYRKIGAFPMYVLVGLSTDDYLGEWWKEVAKNIVLMTLFAFVTFGFSWLMIRAWRRSKAAEEQVAVLAYHDALTGLPNRRLMLDRLQHAVASSARNGRCGALFFIDLDNFKSLNDMLGHDKGDLLLQQVASRLLKCVREDDTVARLGGDEFVVLLEGLSESREAAAAQCETMGEKILAELDQSYRLGGHEFSSTPSIGITLVCGHSASVDELLQQADLAMYQSKAAGRNTMRFFDPEMQAMVAGRIAREADLREAVRRQQFLLHLQPQVGVDGRTMGAEALLRWQHPQRGMVSPAEFIDLAEETGLILPLGLWVLETACAQLARWADNPHMAHLSMAVNVSAKQLQQDDFADQVIDVLRRTGANPRRLKLELTESQLVSNVDETISKMLALKSLGAEFSLDDFGTGYSSLASLKRLPLDQLKIDQGFVRDILVDPNDAAIAKMIVALADSLGLPVVAEGVETREQFDALSRLGCRTYQGYLFGRPVPPDEFEALASSG